MRLLERISIKYLELKKLYSISKYADLCEDSDWNNLDNLG